jgi:hypothetical protein
MIVLCLTDAGKRHTASLLVCQVDTLVFRGSADIWI